MNHYCQLAIIGAGPYGLSIAAHLRERGADFRIFGTPMGTWREQMPKGMLLKSDGFASNLSDPRALLTLRQGPSWLFWSPTSGLPAFCRGVIEGKSSISTGGAPFSMRTAPRTFLK